MISKQETLNLSPYMALYELIIPKDNMLRQINELVDFSFILDELKSKYCLDNGRNAIPPIRMFKYLLLKAIHDLSDANLIERSKYDMSFKYFLDMAPEEDVIDSSSLTKFRRLRLQDMNLLDLLIGKTVEIALERGLITSKTIIVDATHTKARYNQKSPKEFLQEKSKNVKHKQFTKGSIKKDQKVKHTLSELNLWNIRSKFVFKKQMNSKPFRKNVIKLKQKIVKLKTHMVIKQQNQWVYLVWKFKVQQRYLR